jgi:hypothetical protein
MWQGWLYGKHALLILTLLLLLLIRQVFGRNGGQTMRVVNRVVSFPHRRRCQGRRVVDFCQGPRSIGMRTRRGEAIGTWEPVGTGAAKGAGTPIGAWQAIRTTCREPLHRCWRRPMRTRSTPWTGRSSARKIRKYDTGYLTSIVGCFLFLVVFILIFVHCF